MEILAGNNKPKCRLIVFSTIDLRARLGNFLAPFTFDQVVEYETIKFSRNEFDHLRDLYLIAYEIPENKRKMYTETVWNRLFTLIDGHPGLSTCSLHLLIVDFPSLLKMLSLQ